MVQCSNHQNVARFSIKDRLFSFKHAFAGLAVLLRYEHNAWIHTCAACVSVAMGFYFEISNLEWIAILISIGLVFSAEIFNTAIEHLANFIQPDQDIRIKHIKDLGAAGVFVVSLVALAIGLIIFLPKIFQLFEVAIF